MHKIAISDQLLQRIEARRGRVHLFDPLDGAKSALIVIDLQNAFMAPDMPVAVKGVLDIVPNVNRLAQAVRGAGGKVVWIKMTLQDSPESWSVFYDYFTNPEHKKKEIALLSRGNPGHDLYPDLDVQPDDLIVEKTRYSAFIQGSSDLDPLLRSLGIDTVFITGTVTNTCCECSARDAMMLNYKTVFVSDGNAAHNDEEHNATLANMLRLFADVLSTEEIVTRLEGPAAAQDAAAE